MVGEIEIIATAKRLQRSIEVFVDTWKIVYEAEFSAGKSPIGVQYLASTNDAGHYKSIPGNTLITPQLLTLVRNFKHQNRRQTTRSKILTSSPYKRRLSYSQLGAKKTKKTSTPREAWQSKTSAIKVTKTAPTKIGQSWFCILCGDDRVEDMVRCVSCQTWIHATCAGGILPQTTNAISVRGVNLCYVIHLITECCVLVSLAHILTLSFSV